MPESATVVYSAHGVAPTVHELRPAPAHGHRRHLPARDQGARAGEALRPEGIHDPPDRARRPRGGGRDHGRGAGVDDPRLQRRARPRRSSCHPAPARSPTHADDAVGGRDGRDHRGAAPQVPDIRGPQKEDICYATSNRQWAVKEMLHVIDLLLVIGSRNSSNSTRLVEVARANGVEAHLIDDETEIDETWLDGVETVGITSGASAPEKLVTRACEWFRARGVESIEPFSMAEEDVDLPAAGRVAPRARSSPDATAADGRRLRPSRSRARRRRRTSTASVSALIQSACARARRRPRGSSARSGR